MNKLAAAIVLFCLSRNVAIAQTATHRIVTAADAFLATLEPAQKQKVLYAFDDAKQRRARRADAHIGRRAAGHLHAEWQNRPASR
jgi:hypothetical protein